MKEWANAQARGTLKIRAKSKEEHQALLRFKYWCQDNGTSTCRMVIAHSQSLLQADKAIRPLTKHGPLVVNLQQQNTFIHQVERPRRVPDPGLLSFSKRDIPGTTYRLAFEAYVTQKALRMGQPFTFLDVRELSPNHFRKVILRLKRKDRIEGTEPRSCPRLYRLTPKFYGQLRQRILEYPLWGPRSLYAVEDLGG